MSRNTRPPSNIRSDRHPSARTVPITSAGMYVSVQGTTVVTLMQQQIALHEAEDAGWEDGRASTQDLHTVAVRGIIERLASPETDPISPTGPLVGFFPFAQSWDLEREYMFFPKWCWEEENLVEAVSGRKASKI